MPAATVDCSDGATAADSGVLFGDRLLFSLCYLYADDRFFFVSSAAGAAVPRNQIR